MITPARPRRAVAVVVLCHFVAAFAALGMPPFFGVILARSYASEDAFLAGWLYVVPTVFVAISSPWWGRLADRFGKKALLLRAQLGLAASFLLAGFAPGVGWFALALALQGLLGGTFAASGAYLAALTAGPQLTRALHWMQGSGRAALIVAPVTLGFLVDVPSPVELYRYLAVLPLVAALLLWRLAPSPGPAGAGPEAATGKPVPPPPQATWAETVVLESAFVFATVATLPYFVAFAAGRWPGLPGAAAGLLFGLPNLVYLVAAPMLARVFGRTRLREGLGLGLALLALSLYAQAASFSLPVLVFWRTLMGLAMTVCYLNLHGMVAGLVSAADAGRRFGRLESASKFAAVAAGLTAGVAAQLADPQAPFLLGAAVTAVGAAALVSRVRRRARPV